MPRHFITNPAVVSTEWRVATSILGNLFLTLQRNMAEKLSLGPTELLIFMTVAVANIQKLMRERSIAPDFRATGVLPREWVVPISRNAIASAAGLPRETVRRQVAKMIESGLLIEDARGGVTTQIGIIQDLGLEDVLDSLLSDFSRAAEGLLRAGVIELRGA